MIYIKKTYNQTLKKNTSIIHSQKKCRKIQLGLAKPPVLCKTRPSRIGADQQIRLKIVRPHRLAWSRTAAFHAVNRGSNPLGDATKKQK